MVRFIDDHRATYGVEPICAVLPIAPSTYFLQHARHLDPAQRSARAKRDDALRVVIQRVWDANWQVYGPRKVWQQLGREDVEVARCTVERLMSAHGTRRCRPRPARGRRPRTRRPEAVRPPDLVDRDFTATRPNQLWVSDFTYVATWKGFVYVAFVIDVFSPSHRRLAGVGVTPHGLRARRA